VRECFLIIATKFFSPKQVLCFHLILFVGAKSLRLSGRGLHPACSTRSLSPFKVSELFGLRWREFHYEECLLELRETVFRGKLRNWGKTRKALRPVHTPKALADDLWLWRQESMHPAPEDFIFANRTGGFIDPQNYRKKM
jgi:hypothetical protein